MLAESQFAAAAAELAGRNGISLALAEKLLAAIGDTPELDSEGRVNLSEGSGAPALPGGISKELLPFIGMRAVVGGDGIEAETELYDTRTGETILATIEQRRRSFDFASGRQSLCKRRSGGMKLW